MQITTGGLTSTRFAMDMRPHHQPLREARGRKDRPTAAELSAIWGGGRVPRTTPGWFAVAEAVRP